MVAGVVDATDEVLKNVRGFPSEKKLSEKVLALPEECQGKTLTSGEIAPTADANKVVKVSISHGRWKLLSMKDQFSLVDASGEPFAGGAHISENINVVTTIVGGTKMVLKDKDEKPIALAVQDNTRINKAYFIGGLEPMFESDKTDPKVAIGTVDDVTFYPMFKVRDIDDNHLDFRSLLIWNGNNYQPFLRIVPASILPDKPTKDTVPPKKGDLLVVEPKDLDKVHCLMAKQSSGILGRVAGWDLVIAPGADTGAMILLSAVMDDMVGWFA